MSAASPSTDRSTGQADGHLRALVAFAYQQGFHELGYDPLAELLQERDRLMWLIATALAVLDAGVRVSPNSVLHDEMRAALAEGEQSQSRGEPT